MADIRHPGVGAPVYGNLVRLPGGASQELIDVMRGFKRQALHAFRLGFVHPVTEEDMLFEAEIPDDMTELLELLAEDADDHGWY